MIVVWHTLGVAGEVLVLHHSLLGCPLLEPVDIFRIHWSPPEDKSCLFWRVLIFSSPLRFDHGHVLGRLGVFGVQVPLFDLRLVLLFADIAVSIFLQRWHLDTNSRSLEIVSCVHLIHNILLLHRRIQMSY